MDNNNNEIEFYNEPWDDDDDNNNNRGNSPDNNNYHDIATEMQQQIADDIKQQQLQQQALQQKRDEKYEATNNQESKPDIIRTTAETKLENNIIYSYNDIIILNDGREGKIKFIGTLGFESDTWFGLILSTPTGSHNGIVKNRRYWKCKQNHGTFVKKNQIKSIKIQRDGARYGIHQKVKTPKGKAWIRFIGCYNNMENIENINDIEEYSENIEADDNSKIIYGVELLDQMGKNSGSIENEYYFTCAHYRGMFYSEEELVWVPPDAPPTPRISRKSRRKLKDRVKKANKNSPMKDMQIAPSLLQNAKKINGNGNENENDMPEIIGLDENDQSIDLDALDDDGDDEDESFSDSSSDDEFLSSDDVKRISLMANNKIDDRMSFARILSDC